jgi:hypothetical protein
VVAAATRQLRLNLVAVARIASVGDGSSSAATTQGSVALRFAVADASGSAAQGVPAGVSVNVAIPETPDEAPDSEALRVQVEMLDPAAAAASGTDATAVATDDVALRVRLALSDAKVEDPVFTQAPAVTEGVSNTVNVWVPLDPKGNDDADPVKPVETAAAPASGDDRPAEDTAAPAEVVIPVTTGDGTPASSTQTVPLPVTDAAPAGQPAGDAATPIVVQVQSATEAPAEPPAAAQPAEEQPAQKPEPVGTPEPEPAAPQDDGDDEDHCKDRAADEAKAHAAATEAAKADAQRSDDDDDHDDDD